MVVCGEFDQCISETGGLEGALPVGAGRAVRQGAGDGSSFAPVTVGLGHAGGSRRERACGRLDARRFAAGGVPPLCPPPTPRIRSLGLAGR